MGCCGRLLTVVEGWMGWRVPGGSEWSRRYVEGCATVHNRCLLKVAVVPKQGGIKVATSPDQG